MTKKRLTPLNDFLLFQIEVKKMRHKVGFDVVQLRRKFSKYFRTNYLGNRLGLHFNFSGVSLKCIHEPFVNGGCYVLVTSTKYPNTTFDFYVTSNKHFMQKLITHNLI